VILKLSETVNGSAIPTGSHFVFVTGQVQNASGGTDWTVFDPGWNPSNTIDSPGGTPPSQNINSLQGHNSGFFTNNVLSNGQVTNVGPFRSFQVNGVRTYRDISGSIGSSSLSAVANSPVELLVIDPLGRRLGHLAGNGDVFEIPDGSYFRDFPFADDAGTDTANGDGSGIKTAYVPAAQNGTYQLIVTGTQLGTYTLHFGTRAANGTVQMVSTFGIVGIGTTVGYKIAYSSAPGASGPPVLLATFVGILADINNSLQLGLINNQGIATSLSQEIQAAQSATGTTRNNILSAFKSEVNAQAGKSITGIAPQVLLSDANSLISPNH
jgi:hypothetical protein